MKLLALLPIALLLFGCGSDGDGDGGTAPGISNLEYSPNSAHVGEGGGAVTVTGTMDFVDPDGDLDFVRFRYRPCGTGDWTNNDVDITGVSGLTSGTITFTGYIDTTCPPGSNTAQASAFDEAGHQSNTLNASWELLE
jgi:hypothetical protein